MNAECQHSFLHLRYYFTRLLHTIISYDHKTYFFDDHPRTHPSLSDMFYSTKIKRNVMTNAHWVGTNRMGGDSGDEGANKHSHPAVVDGRLRVKGVQGLRIAGKVQSNHSDSCYEMIFLSFSFSLSRNLQMLPSYPSYLMGTYTPLLSWSLQELQISSLKISGVNFRSTNS